MEEAQIDEIFVISDLHAVLASNEGEHATHFQEEGIDTREDRLLQLPLGVFVGEFQEIERVFVSNRTAASA
jgi:hypothetical protein